MIHEHGLLRGATRFEAPSVVPFGQLESIFHVPLRNEGVWDGPLGGSRCAEVWAVASSGCNWVFVARNMKFASSLGGFGMEDCAGDGRWPTSGWSVGPSLGKIISISGVSARTCGAWERDGSGAFA